MEEQERAKFEEKSMNVHAKDWATKDSDLREIEMFSVVVLTKGVYSRCQTKGKLLLLSNKTKRRNHLRGRGSHGRML